MPGCFLTFCGSFSRPVQMRSWTRTPGPFGTSQTGEEEQRVAWRPSASDGLWAFSFLALRLFSPLPMTEPDAQ